MENEITVPGVPQPPLQMITDIAQGMEEGVDIAFRYGYTASEYRTLEQHQPFVMAVMRVRAELEREGHPIRAKARWMTDKLMDEVFLKAKCSTAPLGQVLDAVKTMARIGDLEPKQEKVQAVSGPGTSVQIIFSGGQSASVNIGPQKEEDAPLVFELPLPEKKDE